MTKIERLTSRLLLPALLFLSSSLSAEPPRLVVVVAVDQMRADYLDVFADDYAGGFARLREKGAVFTDAHQDHAITSTSPGHSSISTGVFPSRHGVVANEFFHRRENRKAGAVADESITLVGAESDEGSSPFRMLRSGLSDWLKEAYSESKIVSVSIKDRSAILLGGRSADTAYWLDLSTGRFVTSEYYLSELPAWVETFNASDALTKYQGTRWSRVADDSAYDELPWPELTDRDPDQYASLPRDLGESGEPFNRRFFLRLRGSPFADLETLNFAREMIANEALGEDDVPDILFIGLSAADYIGHRAGPYSDQTHDQFLRLDRYLGDFLAYLDQHVGANNYVLGLSADHGAAPVPELSRDIGLDAGRVHPDTLIDFIRPVVEESVASGEIPSMPELDFTTGPYFVFHDDSPGSSELAVLRSRVAEKLMTHPAVAGAYSYDSLLSGDIADPEFETLFARSFHSERAPDVMVRLRENYILRESQTGTSHGSPYRYDTHVPIVFMGAGIEPGRYTDRIRTVDMAPTLATVLEIAAPDDLDGSDLSTLISIVP